MATGTIKNMTKIEYPTATNVASGYTVTVKKTGNVVSVLATRSTNISLTTGWNTICTIPESARPSVNIDFLGIDNNASAASGLPIQFRLNASGNLNVYAYATGNKMPICFITYIV